MEDILGNIKLTVIYIIIILSLISMAFADTSLLEVDIEDTASYNGLDCQNPTNAYNEIWDDALPAYSGNQCYIYINYTKPNNVIEADVEVKYQDEGSGTARGRCFNYSSLAFDAILFSGPTALVHENFTIPENCISGSTLQMEYWLEYDRGDGASLYEDKVWWNISSSNDITECTNITTPGYYNLTNNTINNYGGTCINISSSDVTFDCKGLTIDGVYDWHGYLIGIFLNGQTDSYLNNITIKNCIINDFSSGIYISYTANSTFENITLNHSYYSGINMWYSSFNAFNNISGIDCGQGPIGANKRSAGVFIDQQSNDNNFTQGIMKNSSLHGFSSYISKRNIITGFNITDNTNGFYEQHAGSNSNLFYDNFFNNTINIYTVEPLNYWNYSLTYATNIIGGSWKGGNYWAYPNGTGPSESCTVDDDEDYICDNPYEINSTNIDYLPLIYDIVGYAIINVNSSQTFVDASDINSKINETNLTRIKEIYAGTDSLISFSAAFYFNFSNVINVSNITMDHNISLGKSYVHNYTGSGIINASLLIPKVNYTNNIYICPGATSLSDVNPSCIDKVKISLNQNHSGYSISQTTINSIDYYIVHGITGTGGGETDNTNLSIWDDTDSVAGSKTIYTSDSIFFYANYTNITDGEPITGTEANCSIRFNTTGDWSTWYNMTYNTEDRLFRYITYFTNINGTFNFSIQCNGTAYSYHLTNASDLFQINYSHWHIFYGNVSGNVTIGNDNSILFSWNENKKVGNVYATDADSSISWGDVFALGRNMSNSEKIDDFTDVDINLQLEKFNNITYYWLNSSNKPYNTTNSSIYSNNVSYVPLVNSTNNSNFLTGILWDSSDDIDGDGGYDQTDKEDLIFVSIVNNGTTGRYGTYDFEIKIPANLTRYKGSNDYIDFYLEIR